MREIVNIILLLSGLIGFSFAAQAEGTENCEAKYKEVAPLAIKMPYREFDQSPEGFRKLGNCWAEASLLLKRYAGKLEYELRGIRWHQAQTLALSGDTAGAVEAALLSINPPEVEQRSNFSWNTYALATIAFLRNDRAAFDAQYEAHRLAAERFPENQNNFKFLIGLSNCFGKPYKDAYGACLASP